jgi:hypothetical protein
MDEFGEFHSIYVWPAGHEDGTAFPEDFYDKLTKALNSVGIEWEIV